MKLWYQMREVFSLNQNSFEDIFLKLNNSIRKKILYLKDKQKNNQNGGKVIFHSINDYDRIITEKQITN